VIATDAILTKAAARRLAIVAHDGFARALWPSHTPHDGDLVFAISTARLPAPDPVVLGAAAASTMSRAIARGIYAASPAPGDLLPTWRQKFG
jgi:L-aminopeptidase/D-esterase-like protein